MHFSWAMDLDPKGANSQIKDALDPALNRASQEDTLRQPADEVHQPPDDEMTGAGTKSKNAGNAIIHRV